MKFAAAVLGALYLSSASAAEEWMTRRWLGSRLRRWITSIRASRLTLHGPSPRTGPR